MNKHNISQLLRALAVILLTAGAAWSAFAGKVSALSEPYAIRQPGTDLNQTEGRHGRHPGHFYRHLVRETSELLGVKQEELVAELKQGRTLLQIASKKKGWSEAEYVGRLQTSITARIDQSVKDGKLSQDKADKFKAMLPGKIQKAVNRSCKSIPDKPGSTPDFRSHQNQVNQKTSGQ
ncbi:hypothetical protein [Paenibacillus tuaregi]|uniref:hypothetical protein n=1 Tax=Paenibacillus tuaregi TaxID=1816681 RepID=UPI000837F5E8|nr:hypothetical protein [Paenibacillus tuaregi]